MQNSKKVIFSFIILFFATGLVAVASTVIGTSIDTEGNLTVMGTSTLSGLLIVEDAIQGVSGSGVPQILLTADETTLRGAGTSTYPIMNITNADMTISSPDINTEVVVADDVISISSNAATMSFDGSDSSISISSGNTGNLVLDSITGAVYADSPFGIPSSDTLPTCNTALAPSGHVALMWDTNVSELCVCDGTSWNPSDGSGTCGGPVS